MCSSHLLKQHSVCSAKRREVRKRAAAPAAQTLLPKSGIEAKAQVLLLVSTGPGCEAGALSGVVKQQAQPPGPTGPRRNVLIPAKVSLLFLVRGGLTKYQN